MDGFTIYTPKHYSGMPNELAPTDNIEVILTDDATPVTGLACEFGWNVTDIKAFKKV